MDIKPLRTVADHVAALKEVERLWEKAKPGPALVVGLRWSRRAVGMFGAVLASLAMVATLFTTGHVAVIACLSAAYAGIALQQPAVLSSCLDIGGMRGGMVAGFMNTAGVGGGRSRPSSSATWSR